MPMLCLHGYCWPKVIRTRRFDWQKLPLIGKTPWINIRLRRARFCRLENHSPIYCWTGVGRLMRLSNIRSF